MSSDNLSDHPDPKRANTEPPPPLPPMSREITYGLPTPPPKDVGVDLSDAWAVAVTKPEQSKLDKALEMVGEYFHFALGFHTDLPINLSQRVEC